MLLARDGSLIEWDGEERRRFSQDHDMIVEMYTMIKSMKEDIAGHTSDDEKHFNRLYKGQARSLWYIAIGIGIIATLKFLGR